MRRTSYVPILLLSPLHVILSRRGGIITPHNDSALAQESAILSIAWTVYNPYKHGPLLRFGFEPLIRGAGQYSSSTITAMHQSILETKLKTNLTKTSQLLSRPLMSAQEQRASVVHPYAVCFPLGNQCPKNPNLSVRYWYNSTPHSVPLAAPLVVPFVAIPLLPPSVNRSLVPPAGATDPRGVPTLDAAAVDSPSNVTFSPTYPKFGLSLICLAIASLQWL